jgi:hypothetical protein
VSGTTGRTNPGTENTWKSRRKTGKTGAKLLKKQQKNSCLYPGGLSSKGTRGFFPYAYLHLVLEWIES